MNNVYNLGNVVGLLRSKQPPKDKPYVIWGKILDESQPLIVELRLYKGSGDTALEANWLPISASGGSSVVNWADIEGKPKLPKSMDINEHSLRLLDENSEQIVSIPLADLLNNIRDFDPKLWYTKEAKNQSQTSLQALKFVFEQISSDITSISNYIGNITSLATKDKTNLVNAINELKKLISDAGTTSIISDETELSTELTYSITKIKDLIKKSIEVVVPTDTPEDYNNLKKLSDIFVKWTKDLSKLDISDCVTYSVQAKTEEQKKQARENIGAISEAFGIRVNERRGSVFTGSIDDLPIGNYSIAISETLTGIDERTLNDLGQPLLLTMFTGQSTTSNEVFSNIIIYGSKSMIFKKVGASNWTILYAKQETINLYPLKWHQHQIKVSAEHLAESDVCTFNLGYTPDTTKRLDVFVNGVLLSSEAYNVEETTKKVTINFSALTYIIKQNDVIITKYIEKE